MTGEAVKRGIQLGAAVAAIVIVAAALLWFELQYAEPAPVPVDDPTAEVPADTRLDTRAALDPARTQWTRSAAPPLWRTVDEGTAASPLPAYEDDWSTAGRVLLDVSGASDAASTWRTGDRFTIEMPQLGETWEPVVERIDTRGYAKSVRALHVDADGRDRRVVVTVGPGRVFAYVDTADGPYELVGNGRLGWLLPSSSMMAGIDFSKPDYLIPEPDQGYPQ